MPDEKTGPPAALSFSYDYCPFKRYSLIVTVKTVFSTYYTKLCFKGHEGAVTIRSAFL